MKITRIEVESREATHAPVGNASTVWSERSALLVYVHVAGDRGQVTVGVGEASPLPDHESDTLVLAELSVGSTPLPLELPAQPLFTLDGAEHFADTLAPNTAASPSARFAFETALADAVARHQGKSLEALLGTPRAIALASLVDSPEAAQSSVEAGARTLKIKVGRSVADDAAKVRAIRAAVGPAVRLRLDANRAFSPQDALAFLHEVKALGIEFIEEPTANLLGVDPALWPVPVALDESLADSLTNGGAVEIIDRLAAHQKLGALVIKPMVLGGLRMGAAWSARANELGVPAVISHTFGGPLELGAALALACTRGGGDVAHGLSPHGALAGWPQAEVAGLTVGAFDPAPRAERGELGLGSFAAWAMN
jgi:o-succinylbenzoate synthase